MNTRRLCGMRLPSNARQAMTNAVSVAIAMPQPC